MLKIGDKVKIKSAYDKGCTRNDYQCIFTEEMLRDYGGKTLTIKSISSRPRDGNFKFPSDDFMYHMEESGPHWKWTVGMFEHVATFSVNNKKSKVKLNFKL